MVFKKHISQSFLGVVVLFCLTTPALANDEVKASFTFRNVLNVISSNNNATKIDTAIATKQNIVKPTRKPAEVQASIAEHNITLPNILTVKPKRRPLPKSQNTRLARDDSRLYKEVFDLQKQGEWSKADDKVEQINDMRLLGYIAYQRYTHPKYNSSETELRNWLNVHDDYAGAYEIYKLANRKFNTYFKKPKKKKTFSHKVVLSNGQKIKAYKSKKRQSKSQRSDIRSLKRNIARDLGRDAPTNALNRLKNSNATQYMDKAEQDILRADIAAAYFYLSLIDKAAPLAIEAANRSGKYAPLAGWIAGLSAWYKQDYKTSGYYFEMAASSKRSSDWMRSASSYWAARAYVRDRSPQKAAYWLKNASRYPRSFYGLIAMQSLGIKKHSYDWSLPQDNDKSNIKIVLKAENGYRAISLLDAGQLNLAMEEIRRINLNINDTELKEALFVLANRYNMPGIAMQLASTVKRDNGKLYDTALYPISPWQPENGFTLPTALIHAFIRQESRFNPYVTSRSGAKGLMQIMPTTASYLENKSKTYFKNSDGQDKLLDPVFNITLGQRYLTKLLQTPSINGNLFQLTAAYNAGPGRLARWKSKMSKQHIINDPLLFIEMIPAAETRAFVEQVMANYWIYNLRFYGRTTNSLRSVASGKWPLYAQDTHIEIADSKTYTNQ